VAVQIHNPSSQADSFVWRGGVKAIQYYYLQREQKLMEK
ncbi:MAG: hypothetical protein JWM44_3689, partial [Bacilli bacterium]|nr:hypothetical protein [Bacilli bacterium]